MLSLKFHNTAVNAADDELLECIKFDDRSSFEKLYKKYWKCLYIYAFNVLREKEICEDIVQDIFIDLWKRRHDVQITNLNSYLYKSVKFQIFNHFRKSKYKEQLLIEFDLVVENSNLDEMYEKKELKIHINNIISKLPARRRLIFHMSRNHGLSNREISENLNISVQTVKNQISESLKFIRNSLKDITMLFF